MAVYHDRNLIINYIPRDMADVELLGLFSRYGSVKTCRIIRDRSTGVSFGFGFCEYETSVSARNAISHLNGYCVNEKVLKVSFARVQETSNTTNLYVKNFPVWVTEQHLCALLSRFGRIVQCRVLRDHTTQQPKGAAYVLFESQTDAELAKENLDGKPWPGSSDCLLVSVRYASPPHRLACRKTSNIQSQRPAVQHNNLPTPDQSVFTGSNIASQFLSACNQRTAPNNAYHQGHHRFPHAQGLIGQNSAIHSALTPLYGVVWPPSSPVASDIPGFSNQFPLTHQGYYHHQLPLAQQSFPLLWPQSFTPGTLQTAQYPNTCLNTADSVLNGSHFNSSLPNFFGSYLAQDVQRPPNLATLGTNIAPPITFDKTADSDRTKSKIYKVSGQTHSLYVYNIGNFTSDIQLYHLFARFGNIINVSVPRDISTGLNKNFGFVTFNSLQSAKSAIETMHGFKFQDRPLQVSFKRHSNNPSPLFKNGLPDSHSSGTKNKPNGENPTGRTEQFSKSKGNPSDTIAPSKDRPNSPGDTKDKLYCDNVTTLHNGITKLEN